MSRQLREELKLAQMREHSAMLTMLCKDDRLKQLDIDIAKLIETKRRIIADAEKAPEMLEQARADRERIERQLLAIKIGGNRVGGSGERAEPVKAKQGETKREHYARLKKMLASLEADLGLDKKEPS